MKVRRLVWSALRLLPRALFVAGLLLRLSVRDGWAPLAPLYYATPWPVLLLLPVPELLFALLRGRFARTFLLAALVVGCAVVWKATSFRPYAPEAAPPSQALRGLFWNVSAYHEGFEAVMEEAAAHDPDLIAMVEAGMHFPDWAALLRDTFPEHRLRGLDSAMIVLWRGDILRVEPYRNADVRLNRLRLKSVHGEVFELLLVDVESDPLRPRGPAFARLGEVIDETGPQTPLLVAGDFNTPSSSVHFGHLRAAGLRSGFATAGEGWPESWPAAWPVLDLDQVWASPQVRLHGVEVMPTAVSDHRSIFFTFTLPPVDAAAANP